MANASVATTAATVSPGKDRGALARMVWNYSVLCTGQNVTVLDQVLTGVAGTAADWETQGSGSHVITAGAGATLVEFKPGCPDYRVRVDAGGTGPTTLVMQFMGTATQDFGS